MSRVCVHVMPYCAGALGKRLKLAGQRREARGGIGVTTRPPGHPQTDPNAVLVVREGPNDHLLHAVGVHGHEIDVRRRRMRSKGLSDRCRAQLHHPLQHQPHTRGPRTRAKKAERQRRARDLRREERAKKARIAWVEKSQEVGHSKGQNGVRTRGQAKVVHAASPHRRNAALTNLGPIRDPLAPPARAGASNWGGVGDHPHLARVVEPELLPLRVRQRARDHLAAPVVEVVREGVDAEPGPAAVLQQLGVAQQCALGREGGKEARS